MAKNSYQRLSAKTKLEIIKRYQKGEKVSALCREYGISRTIFYRWLKEKEKTAPRWQKKKLSPKVAKGRGHWRSLSKKEEKKIFNLIINQPDYSLRKYINSLKTEKYGQIKISLHGLFGFLKRKNLDTVLKRRRFASAELEKRKVKALSPQKRRQMVQSLLDGKKTAQEIAEKFSVSRTTIYKWRQRFLKTKRRDAFYSQRPKGEKHWKAVPGAEKIAVDIIIEYPELSLRQLIKLLPKNKEGRPILGLHGVYNLLKKLNLTTFEQRLAYAETHGSTIQIAPRWLDQVRLVWDQFVTGLAPAPPPAWEQAKDFLRNSALTALITVFTSSIAYKWILMMAQAEPQYRVGLFFASISLLVGSAFFLYSLKYYLTLTVILSFSHEADRERSIFQQNGNQNGSWWQRIFNGNGVKENNDNGTGGMEKDLEEMNLRRKPFVSIHLPLYNEKRVAKRLIKACTEMEYFNNRGKPQFEVIVCDDSTDETVGIVQRYAKKHNQEHPEGPLVKVLHRVNREGFKGAALAGALEQMDPRTEFVSVFDADFIPYPDTLTQFLKYFKASNQGSENYQQSKIAVVGGYQWHVLNKSENWITRGVRTEYAGSYVVERPGRELTGALKQISGSVYMIRADVLKKVGWGTSITEDFELTLKLYERGYKVVYTPYIQAPAECVSTLKRLIRQRMRWAEGHTNNIRRMAGKLLTSANLTFMEKLEVAYLSPYYLQAAFFLLGTFCWLLAETVFPARLPFWTAIWGWSLVLTNLFALPLVNMVGLFLEESEEKDYTGLLSFVALSYILVPFQAYAAIKGFLEKDEGTWFRTPKTGKITDVFSRGRFYRWIRDILPGRGLGIGASMRKLAPAYVFNQESSVDLNYYLNQKTANNQFSKFEISRRQQRSLPMALLVFLLICSTTLVYFAPLIEIKQPPPARAFEAIVTPETASDSGQTLPEQVEAAEIEQNHPLVINQADPEKTPDKFFLNTAYWTEEAEIFIPETGDYAPFILYQYSDRYEMETRSRKGIQKYVIDQNSLRIDLYEMDLEKGIWELKKWLVPHFQYQDQDQAWQDYLELLPLSLKSEADNEKVKIISSFSLLNSEKGVIIPGEMIIESGKVSFNLQENSFQNQVFVEEFDNNSLKKQALKLEEKFNFSLTVWQPGLELSALANQEASLSMMTVSLPEEAELVYTQEEKRLKEDIVLQKIPETNQFQFNLNLIGLRPEKINGQYYFFDEENKPRLKIPQPFMIDEEEARSEDVSLEIESAENGYLVTLEADQEWLSDPVRKYPVIIDPTIEVVLNVLTVHSHPEKGEHWSVDFETIGLADLMITPDDQASIDDLDFVSLSCDGETRTPEIRENDVLFYPNWQCENQGTVVHYVKQAGDHVLKLEFGDQFNFAYNSSNISTTTYDDSTDYSTQRKTWWDGTRIWAAFHADDDTRIEFWYSTDWGSSWTENTSARLSVDTNDFTIEGDSSDLFIAYTNGNDIEAREDDGNYPGTGFGWGAATVVYNGTGAPDTYYYPSMTKDSNDKVWISATYYKRETLDERVAASLDDSYGKSGGNTNTATITRQGYSSGTYWAGYRFTSVGVPQGADIESGTVFKGYERAGLGGPVIDLNIYGEDVDDAADFTSSGPSARTATTANTDWDPTRTYTNNWHTSVAIDTIVEEITDRSGWSSGNDLNIIIKGDVAVNEYISFEAEDHVGNNVARLSLVYRYYDVMAIQASNANDISAWGSASSLDVGKNSHKFSQIVSLGSGNVYVIWVDDTAIEGKKYTGSWGSADSIDTGKTSANDDHLFSAVVDATNGYIHLIYIDSNADVLYRNYTSSWQSSTTLLTGTARDPTLSIDTANENLYAFWASSGDIYYKKGTHSTGSWTWDGSATTWQTSGTCENVTSNYGDNGMVYALWMETSGSPEDVVWDFVIIPERLWMFLFLSPFAGIFFKKLKKKKKFRKEKD